MSNTHTVQMPFNTPSTPLDVAGIRRPPLPPEKLKAERVQEALKAMPGWKLTRKGRAINRAYRFASTEVAMAYASYVSALAQSTGQRIHLSVADGRVAVTVYGEAPPPPDADGWLDAGNLAFAFHLG